MEKLNMANYAMAQMKEQSTELKKKKDFLEANI